MGESFALHPLIEELKALGLPPGDWALFGSGPLLIRGWIDEVGDLDVITRGAAWDRVMDLGELSQLPNGAPIVHIGRGITAGTTWAFGDVDIDLLIETAESIDGVPCVLLEHVIAYKRIADRPKDRAHLAIISARK